jgi:hypothetical protein
MYSLQSSPSTTTALGANLLPDKSGAAFRVWDLRSKIRDLGIRIEIALARQGRARTNRQRTRKGEY